MTIDIPRPLPPLNVFDPTSFQGRAVPTRQWVVPEWIPAGVVTGLYGDGGTGKTLLVQQLQSCTALGRSWLGLETQPMRSLGVYCEDHLDELHRRQSDINKLYGCDFEHLGDMRWLPRLGEDNLLMQFKNGEPHRTKFCDQIIALAKTHGAQLVIIDTVSDTFGGNENDRGHVRQYVQTALGYIARETGGTVIVCAHPSRTGLTSGEGDGGSTGWSNAFRSRLSLEALKKDKDDRDAPMPDPDARVLARRKANYAMRNDVIDLRWQAGAFVTASEDSADRPAAENVFLDLLDRMTGEGRKVSHNSKSGNYAPKQFVRHQDSEGYRVRDFERAMNALFDQGEIKVASYGRKGKEAERIERCDNGIPF